MEDPAFDSEGLPTGNKMDMSKDLTPVSGGDDGKYAGIELSPWSKAQISNNEFYGGLSSVLIPVEQTSLVSTFNIMVVVIIVLVLILIYYVMQLQKKQSCKSVRRPKSIQPIQPENDPLDLSVVQDQSMEGFSVNRAVTDYMSYGNVPVHSSNSAVLAVGTYDGQTYIPNSSKNKLMRDALQKRLMGARSRTDDQSMVEYENARKMG